LERSPTSTASIPSSNQESPSILWKVHYRCHKNPQCGHILSHFNPVHVLLTDLLKTHVNIILPSTLKSASGLFPGGFPPKP